MGANANKIHLLFEMAIAIGSTGWMLYFLRRYLQLLRVHKIAAAEADEWRQKASQLLEGISQSIETQFETWGLTTTEKEIALLLIKGFSTKEIATVRQGSERTVRQHAQSIYSKSKLAGRAELAAYFLEDFLGPSL